MLAHFDYGSLAKQDREELIAMLAELCNIHQPQMHSETAMSRLLAIAEEGGPGAQKAVDLLVGRQMMTRSAMYKVAAKWHKAPEPDTLQPKAVADFIALSPRFAGREQRLSETASQWMKTKSLKFLSDIYEEFIVYLDEGVPIATVLAILGTPTKHDPRENPRTYIYASDEGPDMQLHVSEEQRLVGWGLK